MECSDFLPSMINQSLRKKLCDHFQKAEENAKIHFENTNGFVEIKFVVDLNKGNYWNLLDLADKSQGAYIVISPDSNHEGSIIHEVFHSAFHEAPSYQINYNWGEALCDAFRYFMEKKYIDCTKSYFYKGIIDWIKRDDYDDSQIRKLKEDDLNYKKDDLNYKYLPSRIIRKSNYDYDKFKDIWKILNNNHIIFDNYFLEINHKVHEAIS